MKRHSKLTRFCALFFFFGSVAACYVDAHAGGEECRNVEVRNRHDVEVCKEHCNNNGCHEHCAERERFSREHRCWAD